MKKKNPKFFKHIRTFDKNKPFTVIKHPNHNFKLFIPQQRRIGMDVIAFGEVMTFLNETFSVEETRIDLDEQE